MDFFWKILLFPTPTDFSPYAGRIFTSLSHKLTLCPLSDFPLGLTSSRNSHSCLKFNFQIWKELASNIVCKNCNCFSYFCPSEDDTQHILFVTNSVNKIFIRELLLFFFNEESNELNVRTLLCFLRQLLSLLVLYFLNSKISMVDSVLFIS